MATRITSEYDSHTKDELLSEVEARGIEGVTSASLKADIIAALALDDETGVEYSSSDSIPQPPEPLPKIGASSIPQLPKAEALIPRVPGDQPKDEEYTDGIFIEIASGEPYALAIVEPSMARDGKTHFAKNSLHFWNGTEAEFRAQFDKK